MNSADTSMPFADVNASMFEERREFALYLDSIDPFAEIRSRFHIPTGDDGQPSTYLVGNSLGLQPVGVREILEQELTDWAELGVRGHLEASRPWLPYHEFVRPELARLVGAEASEVVAMNTLTVNLHLLLVSFFRPEGDRRAILIEDGAFPSDLYAVQSHLASRGLDPDRDLILASPREGESLLRTEDIVELIRLWRLPKHDTGKKKRTCCSRASFEFG